MMKREAILTAILDAEPDSAARARFMADFCLALLRALREEDIIGEQRCTEAERLLRGAEEGRR